MNAETKRIQMIQRLLDRRSPHVEIGIGDDAAVLKPTAGRLVCSVDSSVEGVHFRRDWVGLREIGRRAFMAAASDLAAMGAEAYASMLAITVPNSLSDSDLRQLILGVSEAANLLSCPVVGGNLSTGGEISLTTTVLGQAEVPLTRTGARAGDVVAISGTVGDAGLGLKWLQHGGSLSDTRARAFIQRWRRPEAQLRLGVKLRGVATSAIDVSDGLWIDLGHLGSRVGFEINAEDLPLTGGFRELCGALEEDPIHMALHGGEDYGLLFTCAEGDNPPGTTVIGRVTSSPGVRILDTVGARISVPAGGYSHF